MAYSGAVKTLRGVVAQPDCPLCRSLLSALSISMSRSESCEHGCLPNHVENSLDKLSHEAHIEGDMDAREFKTRRKALGITQEECADLLEVTRRTLTRWESGRTKIDNLRAGEIRTRFAAYANEHGMGPRAVK